MAFMLNKNDYELLFWSSEIENITKWYEKKITNYYNIPSPSESEKIVLSNLKDSALMTWHKVNQEKNYPEDLCLDNNIFSKKKILDIGCGGLSGATVFQNSELFLLDPLWPEYIKAGYPIHYYRDKVKIVAGKAETIPLVDNSMDAVISVNALDHVDNFEKTATEIGRVLKEGGILRVHLHYHKITMTEPIALSDNRVAKAFSWCKNFRKINKTFQRRNHTLGEDESYTLWGNT